MSKEAIVERILSDARAQSDAIISEAEKKAEEITAQAEKRADRARQGCEAEIKEKSAAIIAGKEAAARLDSSKIMLAAKRRVLDGVYSAAMERLKNLSQTDAVKFAAKLIEEYAEDGDEIAFADDFPYARKVTELPCVKQKKLTFAFNVKGVNGGMILRGKNADKDVSYAALLASDREAHQAEVAAKIFSDKQ